MGRGLIADDMEPTRQAFGEAIEEGPDMSLDSRDRDLAQEFQGCGSRCQIQKVGGLVDVESPRPGLEFQAAMAETVEIPGSTRPAWWRPP